jgi:hypothetical protein
MFTLRSTTWRGLAMCRIAALCLDVDGVPS